MSRKRKRRRGDRPRGLLSLELLPPEVARARMRLLADSQDWWMFVVAGRHGAHFLADLEQRHFAGPRSKGFQLLMIPALGLGILGIAFAQKALLSTRQLCPAGAAGQSVTLSHRNAESGVASESYFNNARNYSDVGECE
jgi:hypothetical protein